MWMLLIYGMLVLTGRSGARLIGLQDKRARHVRIISLPIVA